MSAINKWVAENFPQPFLPYENEVKLFEAYQRAIKGSLDEDGRAIMAIIGTVCLTGDTEGWHNAID